MSDKKKKNWLAKHAKSSAALISLGIHVLLILVAISFVAVTVIQKEEQKFEAKHVKRPQQKLKKLKVPMKTNKKKPKPKLRKRLVVKNVKRNTPEFQLPEITGVKGGIGAMGDGGGPMETIGFSMPELDFFGTKAKGEKICFLVHFGPATIGEYTGKPSDPPIFTPFSRMTGLTIRNRLAELVAELPSYALYNVAAFTMGDTWALSPIMLPANPSNKQKLMDWMDPVNPLEGEYEHCFSIPQDARRAVNQALSAWPTRVEEELPFYATKWAYPYEIEDRLRKKYAPDAAEFTVNKAGNPNWQNGKAFSHWARALGWALLEQKPDTIFILTTNYIDGWQVIDKKAQSWDSAQVAEVDPDKSTRKFATVIRDIYGPDKKNWPSVNIVVLTPAGKNVDGSYKTLNDDFGKIWKSFNGQGSVIEDIKDYMNEAEKDQYYEYRGDYGNL